MLDYEGNELSAIPSPLVCGSCRNVFDFQDSAALGRSRYCFLSSVILMMLMMVSSWKLTGCAVICCCHPIRHFCPWKPKPYFRMFAGAKPLAMSVPCQLLYSFCNNFTIISSFQQYHCQSQPPCGKIMGSSWEKRHNALINPDFYEIALQASLRNLGVDAVDVIRMNPVTFRKRNANTVNTVQIVHEFVERFCPEMSCGKVWKWLY